MNIYPSNHKLLPILLICLLGVSQRPAWTARSQTVGISAATLRICVDIAGFTSAYTQEAVPATRDASTCGIHEEIKPGLKVDVMSFFDQSKGWHEIGSGAVSAGGYSGKVQKAKTVCNYDNSWDAEPNPENPKPGLLYIDCYDSN